MLVVKENGEELDIIEEEFFYAETEDKTVAIGNVENLNIELSINSVVGLSNSGTMKVKGKILGTEVVVLIDCGATHSFIVDNLVTSLKLPLTETSNCGVILGSGAAVKGKGICGQVEVMVGEWKIVDSFLPLELRGVDVILDMQWLHSLGVTEFDWRKLVMTFQHEGKKVVIRGDPSLTKMMVSLKSMMKSWNVEDQGYRVECRAMEGRLSVEGLCSEEETTTVDTMIPTLLSRFSDVFEWPEELPQERGGSGERQTLLLRSSSKRRDGKTSG